MTRIRNGQQAYSRLAGRSIICVGTADWQGTLWTNQQHLMLRLARENDVVFSESLGLRRPTLAGRDLRRMAQRMRSAMRGAVLRDGVWVVSPLVIPLHDRRPVRRANRVLLKRSLRRAARAAGLARPILWAYNPHAHELLGALDESLVIYHCVDDVAAQEHVDEASFAAAERELAALADLVIVSSRPLVDHVRRQGAREVAYLPNVADVGHFAAANEMPEPAELRHVPRPRLLFAGAVAAKKLDVPLLAALARRRPDWSLVLLGPVGEGDPRGDLSALRGLANVHLPGGRSFAALPAWVGAADVCLIPYAQNDYTASVFPMKLYEYLAAGKPVVSTPVPALAGLGGLAFATGAEAFERAIEGCLAGDGPERMAERRSLAERNSWDRRLEEIAELVTRCEEGRRR